MHYMYCINKKTLVRNKMSAKDILKLVEEKEAKFIDYRFTNTQGKEQHVTVTATEDGINTD